MSPPVSGRLRSNSSGASLHSRSHTSVAPSTTATSSHKSSPRTSKASPGRPSVRVNTFTAAASTTVNSTISNKPAPTHTRLPASTAAALPRSTRIVNASLSVSRSNTCNASGSPSLSASTPQHTDTIHASQLLLASSSADQPEPSQSSVARVSSYSHAVVLATDRKVSSSTDDEERSAETTTSRHSQSSRTHSRDDEDDDKSEHKTDNSSTAAAAAVGPMLRRNGFGQVLSKERVDEPSPQQADLVCAVSLPASPASPTSPKLPPLQQAKEKEEKKASNSAGNDDHPFQPTAGREDNDVVTPLSAPKPTSALTSPALPTRAFSHVMAQLSSTAVAGSVSVSAASTSRSPTHSVSRPLQPLHAAILSPHTTATATNSAGQRRTMNGNKGGALPRLPFLTSPSAAASNAVPTAAGPEGFLASLNPHVASPRASHSPADPLLSHDAVTAVPQHRSPSVVVRSTRPFSLHRANKHSTLPAEAKRATFFASVAHALGRMSVTQQRINGVGGIAGLADLAARRPSLSSLLAGRPSGGAVHPPLPMLKTGDEVTEVTAMSPHFNPRSPSPQLPSSPNYAAPTPFSASSTSPTGAAPTATRHFNSLTAGNYSHHPHTAAQSQQSARPPPLPSNGGELDEKFLESWSESDDPLSPASFQQIVPGVYLGSAKSAMNVDRLIEHRITHILTVMNRPLNFLAQAGDVRDADILSFTVQRDCNGDATTSDCPPTQVPSAHPLFTGVMHALTTHFVYLLDLPEADLLSALNDCIPYLLHAHLHCRGRVLIHCQAGISRSASVVIAYLVRLYGWNVRQAYEVCYEARPYIHPNEGFVSQLELYARAEERRRRRERRRWRDWMRRGGWVKGGGGKERWWKALNEDVRPRLLPAEARIASDGSKHSARWGNQSGGGS